MFWSGNFLLGRLMHDQIPPIQMSFWRWTFAFLILLPFALRQLPAHHRALREESGYLVLLGLVGITAYNCFIYSALHHTTVLNVSIINTLMPVVTFLLAMLLLGERHTPRRVAGALLAFAGAAVIIFRGDPAAAGRLDLNLGDVLVLFGLTAWALYTVLIRWRPTRLPLSLFLGATVAFGLLFHLPLLAWELPRVGAFSPTPAAAGSIFYFAVFPSVLAYLLWNRAVALLGPATTGVFMYLLPVYGIGLGILFLGERFRPFHAGGLVLIVAGLALVSRRASG